MFKQVIIRFFEESVLRMIDSWLYGRAYSTYRNSHRRPKPCNFIEKETLAQVFPCEFCEIFKNTFVGEHLSASASAFTINLLLKKYSMFFQVFL